MYLCSYVFVKIYLLRFYPSRKLNWEEGLTGYRATFREISGLWKKVIILFSPCKLVFYTVNIQFFITESMTCFFRKRGKMNKNKEEKNWQLFKQKNLMNILIFSMQVCAHIYTYMHTHTYIVVMLYVHFEMLLF